MLDFFLFYNKKNYNEKNCKVFQVIFSRFLAFQTNVQFVERLTNPVMISLRQHSNKIPLSTNWQQARIEYRLLSVFCKWIHERPYVWTAEKDDWSSQLYTQLKQLWKSLQKIQAWTGFEPMSSATPIQWPTNWGIKPSGSWSHCEFVVYPWRMQMNIYEGSYIWTAEKELKTLLIDVTSSQMAWLLSWWSTAPVLQISWFWIPFRPDFFSRFLTTA